MRVWFLEIGEPSPLEPNARLHRYGLLTKQLAAKGHEPIWWTSNFSHAKKTFVAAKTQDVTHDGVLLKIIAGPGYKSNISLQRMLHYRDFRRQFVTVSQQCPPPDIVVAPIPTIEIASVGVRYAIGRNIPVVTDIRDEWPDEIKDLAPPALRPLARIALNPLYEKMRYVCNSVNGIVGISQRQLEYGLSFSGRSPTDSDVVIPHGYTKSYIDSSDLNDARDYWRQAGIRDGAFIGCFFGTIGRFFDLETVIEASKIIGHEIDFQAVLCGSGSSLQRYKKLAANSPHILFPGWVNAPKIAALMQLSAVGLAPYRAGTAMALPNKPFEYMAGGLPIVSSIQSELREILEQEQCGQTYRPGDAQGLANILRYYANSPQERIQQGKNALKALETRFTTEKVADDWEQYLQSIIARYHP